MRSRTFQERGRRKREKEKEEEEIMFSVASCESAMYSSSSIHGSAQVYIVLT